MKQNISDGSTATKAVTAASPAHLPSPLKVQGNKNHKSTTEEKGAYFNPTIPTDDTHFEDNNSFGNLSPDLSHRRNLSPPSSGCESRTTSMNSLDFAEMINRQQQSLAAIASQHQTPVQSPNSEKTETEHSEDLQENHNHFPILANGHQSNGSVPIESARNGSVKKRNNSDLSSHLSTPNTIKTQTMVNLKGETVVPMPPSMANDNANGDESNLDDKTDSSVDVNKWDSLRRLLSGVALTLLSAFFFSVTTVIVKFVTDIKPSQMALFRYLGKFALVFIKFYFICD